MSGIIGSFIGILRGFRGCQVRLRRFHRVTGTFQVSSGATLKVSEAFKGFQMLFKLRKVASGGHRGVSMVFGRFQEN